MAVFFNPQLLFFSFLFPVMILFLLPAEPSPLRGGLDFVVERKNEFPVSPESEESRLPLSFLLLLPFLFFLSRVLCAASISRSVCFALPVEVSFFFPPPVFLGFHVRRPLVFGASCPLLPPLHISYLPAF